MAENNDLGPLQYEELKLEREIRLVHLLPGDESAEIQCSLFRVDLDKALRTYIALSYVWGDPSMTEARMIM